MKRIIFTTLTLFSLLANLQLTAQEQFSLDDAIAYAMENAASLKNERLNIEDAEGQILEYKSIGIPQIYLNSSYTYRPGIPVVPFPDFVTPQIYNVLVTEDLLPDGTEIPGASLVPARFGTDQVFDAGVTLDALLFDFSWVQGLKAQEMYRELVVRQLDVAEYQVRATITQAYIAVLISERTVELIEDNLQNVNDLLTETRALYENGFAEQLDVDRLELSRENLETEYESVIRSIEITENILKFQMGYPVYEDIVLTDEFDSLTDKLIVEGADLDSDIDFLARPEYRALLMTEELNLINQKVIKAGYMPSFSFGAGYSQTLNRNKLFDEDELGFFAASFMGVKMSMPIFDGLERRAKLDRAKVATQQAEIRRQEFENSMTMEVRNARISYTNAAETVRARRRAMDLADSIYKTTQIKYREGVGSSVEQTQAESELYTAQSNYINALYDLLVAKTDLDIALGKM